ncbi:MAG: enoyl-CoA hydratase-related protein [Solirubrobacteraceae bacterium]|jgi:2-(1,2-epoxy-1,2-dihydrophenyl)acetyl-CoA isomerase|nr:enoyl-CoA hydratase-related protein [Solirubrobacteraceae bacterium]
MTLVLSDVAGGVARLTLNRPQAGNALDPELAAALADAAEGLHGRDDVRVVLLGAAGPMFCVGGDLGFMAQAPDPGAAVHALATDFHRAIEALAALPAPVVTVVRGVAAGGGLGLITVADLVLAGSSARFTMAYTAAGLSPDGGTTFFLPRLVGLRRAAELALLNERLSADAAREIGLVSRVVADDDLEAEADALAARLAAGPADAYAAVKRLLRASGAATLGEQLAAEADAIAANAGSPDGREGVAAFLEKRAPAFGA